MAVGMRQMPWLVTSVRKAIAWHAGRGAGSSKREWHVLRRMQYNSIIKHGLHCTSVGSLSRDGETEQSQEEVQDVQKESEFTKLGVDTRLANRLEEQGISSPTPVQEQAIPTILQGSNTAIQCYTGSGKTLAYLLPVLTISISRAEEEWSKVTRKTAGMAGTVQAVVVVPSRELAMQIVRVAQSVLPAQAKQSVQQCIGGANIHRQREALKLNRPIMVVGTPGRLAELSRDGSLQTHKCGILVLDEIDQLLAPQFREEMVRITEHTGKKFEPKRQTIAVSATMTARVLSMCSPWCPKPEQIFIDTDGNRVDAPKEEDEERIPSRLEQVAKAQGEFPSRGWGDPDEVFPQGIPITTGSAGGYGGQIATPSVAPGLDHVFIFSAPQHKVDALRRVLNATEANKALVFMNFQHRLKDSEARLKAKKIRAASLHGEMTKVERRNALDAFRSGKIQVLLVSDVAARGLDVPDCDAVVNLELPSDPAHYAHRAGRTGRGGRPGTVVSIVTNRERFVVQKFESALGIQIDEVEARFGSILPASRGDED